MPSKNLLFTLTVLILASFCACQNKSSKFEKTPEYSVYKTQYHSIDSIEDQDELSKIIISLEGNKIDSILLKAIWKKSDLFSDQNSSDSVLKYDRLLLKKAMDLNNLFYTAMGESYLAYDFRELQQFDSAFYYYQKAKNSYLKLSDSTQAGKKLLEMGKIQYRQNDFYGSKESLTEALQFLNEKKDREYVIWCWNELGNNYSSLKDFKNAEENYKRAIKEENNKSDKLLYINNLAVLYSKNKEYSKAIELLRKAIDSIPNNFSKSEYARLLHNKAENEWRLNSSDVLDTYLNVLKIRKQHHDKRGLLSSYASLAEFYESSNLDLTKKYIDTLIILSRKLKIPRAETEALQLLMRIEPNEISHLVRYISLKDSMYLQELKVKNQFAFLKYQDQEEKSRLLTLEAANAKQEAQLAQEETQKILFLSTSALLVMGGISLFFLLKQRHKKEKLQEVYNTEKRISQRLHDGLANDIFSLMTKVENIEQIENDTFLDGLETIYARTREISHENSNVNTGELFSGELKSLIKTFHSNTINIITKGLEDIEWASLNEQKCVVLHRTLKELLVNMKKHSKASLVGLHFSSNNKIIKIDYKDNGVGFPTDIKYGLGLRNVVSRIRSCGGTFNFTQKSGTGVSIEISLPNKSGI